MMIPRKNMIYVAMVLVAAIILYFVIRRRKMTPATFEIPGAAQLTELQKQDVQQMVRRLREVITQPNWGRWLWGADASQVKTLEDFYIMPDALFIATYNTYNKRFYSVADGTLYSQLMDEKANWSYKDFIEQRNLIIQRMANLNLT